MAEILLIQTNTGLATLSTDVLSERRSTYARLLAEGRLPAAYAHGVLLEIDGELSRRMARGEAA